MTEAPLPSHHRPPSKPPARKLGFVKAVGILGILGGIALIVVGVVIWIDRSRSPADAPRTSPSPTTRWRSRASRSTGPFTAYVQADIIKHHALEASDGKTYAELDAGRPGARDVMQASFLRASLFTSVVSYGVAAVRRRRSASSRSSSAGRSIALAQRPGRRQAGRESPVVTPHRCGTAFRA